MIARRFLIIACCCAVALAWTVIPGARLAIVSGVLLFGPGFLFARILPLPNQTSPFAQPTLWLGLSLSLIALLYQWVTAFSLSLNLFWLAILAISCAIGVMWVCWRSEAPLRFDWSVVVLAAILAATFGVRLYQIRDLALPAWVDSVHHALMIRVAIERGQAPINLYPYLPIANLPYHWGYHVLAAASTQLSGEHVPQVMLWQGQGLNALHVLTCAALASLFWRRPSAGLVAGLIVGAVSIMPAYYVSWGRYTQLTGLLLLPGLAIAWDALLKRPGLTTGTTSAVILAGLSLIHFRILIFALALLLAQTIVWACTEQRGTLLRGIGASALASITALLLTAPWLWLLLQRRLVPTIQKPASFFASDSYAQVSDGLLWAGNNRLLVALALSAALWCLWQRAKAGPLFIVWVGLLILQANPALIVYVAPAAALPLFLWAVQHKKLLFVGIALLLLACNPWLVHPRSSWLITNDVVAISLFIPISVLIAGPICELLSLLWNQRSVRLATMLGPAAAIAVFVGIMAWGNWLNCLGSVVGIATWGDWNTCNIINTGTILATQADVEAIAWADQHTAPDARFLIGAAPWLASANRGVDGGWWLMPLIGRWTSTPPVIFDYGSADYVHATRERTNRLAALYNQTGDDISKLVRAEVQRVIAEERINYIYIGPNGDPLNRAALSELPEYQTVYQRDGVTILAVREQT